jgi:hypothetical protein
MGEGSPCTSTESVPLRSETDTTLEEGGDETVVEFRREVEEGFEFEVAFEFGLAERDHGLDVHVVTDDEGGAKGSNPATIESGKGGRLIPVSLMGKLFEVKLEGSIELA